MDQIQSSLFLVEPVDKSLFRYNSGSFSSLVPGGESIKNLNAFLPNLANITFSSMVVREKSQYRLFYYNSIKANSLQQGIIGTFKISSTGAAVYEWSETKGIPARRIHAGTDENNSEVLYHASDDGYVYSHDTGDSFGGETIAAIYKLTLIHI